MLLNFSHNTEHYDNDLRELVKGFFPMVVLSDEKSLNMESAISDTEKFLDMKAEFKENEIKIEFSSDVFSNFKKVWWYSLPNDCEVLERKRLEKRYMKIALYRTLSYLADTNLPYGALTGIRPTKLYRELGVNAGEMFRNDFSVSDEKVQLIKNIVELQEPLLNRNDEYDLFINIPFCPSRCAYCSFVSVSIDKQREILKPYIDCLIKELKCQKELVKSRMLKIRAVYVGGGTPTSLPLDLLKKLLLECDFGQREFTVEAGRPDTINRRVVSALKKAKVTRVSVNPQSFHDKTLLAIGRNHTVADTLKAFKLVSNKFDVNMDLIAMLPNETLEDFKLSVDTAIKLKPANITVHTLYLKKGSALMVAGYQYGNVELAKDMVLYAQEKLMLNGYNPYYMYRQKYTLGNLENVGYAKSGKECLYNIDIMEEDTSILAVGAGAIAKKYTKSNNFIKRCPHCKEPQDYIKRFDEMLEKNMSFWKDEN